MVAASPAWLADAKTAFDDAGRDAVFDPARLAALAQVATAEGVSLVGPLARFVAHTASLDRLARDTLPEVLLVAGDAAGRFDAAAWPNALSRSAHGERPVQAVAHVLVDGAVVGVASISADTERLWQIGLDVAPAHRRSGIGAALTRALCRFALERHAVPYYSAALSNLASMRTAHSAGMVLGWMEVTSIPTARLLSRRASTTAPTGSALGDG